MTAPVLQRLRRPRRQRAAAILASLALLLQALFAQALPLKAEATATYLLLCTEAGLVAVALDGDDTASPHSEFPEHEGPHCPACLLPITHYAPPSPAMPLALLDLSHERPAAAPESIPPRRLFALPRARSPPV